jgi:hypothetical protein
MKWTFLLVLFWVATATADVDAHFGKGALNAAWGSTLQSVQAMYPGGTAWPQKEEDGVGEVVYAVSGNFRVLGMDLKPSLVHFVFTKQDQLQRAFFHFRFNDREAALYEIAQVLGQDYSIRDEAGSRAFTWKEGQASFAKFEVSSHPQFGWCLLAVRSMTIAPGSGR